MSLGSGGDASDGAPPPISSNPPDVPPLPGTSTVVPGVTVPIPDVPLEVRSVTIHDPTTGALTSLTPTQPKWIVEVDSIVFHVLGIAGVVIGSLQSSGVIGGHNGAVLTAVGGAILALERFLAKSYV